MAQQVLDRAGKVISVEIASTSETTADIADLVDDADIPGQVATAVGTAEAQTVQTKTADYGLVLGDDAVVLNKATAIAVNVPLNATQAFPVGTQIAVTTIGAGAATVTATGGVTLRIRAFYTAVLAGQYARATLLKIATDTWVLSGDLTAA